MESPASHSAGLNSYSLAQKIGLWVGLCGALTLVLGAPYLPLSSELEPTAWSLVAVTFLVGCFWVSEALPLGATSLIPAALFPILGIMSTAEVSKYYISPVVLLLLGGFLLAMAVERTGAHQRLALMVLLRVGTSPQRLVLGFTITAAVMSMWISNTATALMMMPVALAVADRAAEASGEGIKHRAFSVALLLGTGYGASVGGMGTPVGTPPNLIALKALNDTFPDKVYLSFVDWLFYSVPVVIIIVPLIWYSLVWVYPKVPSTLSFGARQFLEEELRMKGAWTPSERRALTVFAVTAILWVTRADLQLGDSIGVPGWATLLGLTGTHDGMVAIGMAVLAFALPSGNNDGFRILPWSSAQNAPWGLVLLFGGGVALSKGFEVTGVSSWLGTTLAYIAEGSIPSFIALATFTGTFGTEIMSNTALANMLMPILASTAYEAQIDPRAFVWPVALACSCAFMMPAATGPNAIVFGSDRIRIIEMVRSGFIINWLAWAVIVVVALMSFSSNILTS